MTIGFRPLALLLTLTACGSSGGEAPATSEPAPERPAQPPATEAPATEDGPDFDAPASHQGESYSLSLTAEEGYQAGALSSFAIDLTPRGEWHVNQEYPIHIDVAGQDGITLPKAELERADAATFTERAVRFLVPFTPATAGQPKVAAKVSFAMCTAENCIFHDETVALALPVQ